MLSLRRGRVTRVAPPEGGWQALEVEIDGRPRPAQADVGLVGPAEAAVRAAEAALAAAGAEPRHIVTGGGSDAAALMANGFPCCVNLANGTERNHQPDESVSVAALELMLDVTLALLDESASVPC